MEHNTQVWQEMSKQNRNGIPGTVEMIYDRETYRFSDYTGFSPYGNVKKLQDDWIDW